MNMSPAAVSEPDGCTRKLCTWIHDLSLADVPEEVQTRVKHLILDGLACAFVGAHLPWSIVAASGVFGTEPRVLVSFLDVPRYELLLDDIKSKG